LVKNHQLQPTRPLFGALLGLTQLEFRRDLWRQKTRVPGLSYGVICVILYLVLLVQCRLVTDKRMDRQTNTRKHHILH